MKRMMKQISKTTKSLLVLLIIFSNSILPLNVLAEELQENTINNYKITINDTELTSDTFTIDEFASKKIKIVGNYIGEDTYIYLPQKELEIDFTNRLYGNYKYNLSVSNESEQLAEKNIIINNIGDNNSIINTNNIYYKNRTYFILGNLEQSLTTLDIINKFNNNLSIYNATLEIVDKDNNILNNDSIVEDDNELKLKASYDDYGLINEKEENYLLNIVEDINEDEKIDNKDIQKILVDKILNQEANESIFNILDATNVVLENPQEDSIDNFKTTFEYNTNVFLDEEIILNYYIEGFNEEVLKGIEGIINYDKNILELKDVEINSIDGNINESGHFIYLLNDYNQDGVLITFKFKPLAIGTTEITIENIIGSTGSSKKANLDTDNYEAEINILEYGTGGDVDNESEPPTNNEEQEEIITLPSKEQSTTSYIKPILLSGDNFIKTLTISGHELNFNKDVLEYELYVKNNINSLDLTIELNDNNSSYVVTGNQDFKSGENLVKIVVTAENGNTKTYTIKVNKESREIIEEEQAEKENNSKAIIIFLIILVIIGLVYVIFKDDETDEK